MGVRIHNSRGHTKAWESITPTRGATPKRGSLYPQLKGPHQSVGVHHPHSRGHTEAWESIIPTGGATPKRGNPYPKLKGPHRSAVVRIPNSRGHTKSWELVSPTIGATPKQCADPQLKGPHGSVGVRIPNPRGHTEKWSVHIPNSRSYTEARVSISRTQGPTPKRESPSTPLKAWESLSATQEAIPKGGYPYPQLKGPHRSAVVRIPNSRGHTDSWEFVSPTTGATPKQCADPQLKGHTEAWVSICPTLGATPKHGCPNRKLKGPD